MIRRHRHLPERTAPQSAFTLIELLVVFAIFALLTALLLPADQRARKPVVDRSA